MITKTIGATQLAFVLSIKTLDAKKKIYFALNKLRKNNGEFDEKGRYSIDVEDFEKVHKIDLSFALRDIHDNCMKRAATRKHILELPLAKIESKSFKEGMVIKLPPILKSLLSHETITEIKDAWDKYYADKKVILRP